MERVIMYIIIVGRGYPTNKYKTNGIFEVDQAKSLARYGHKVIYISIDLRSFRHKRKMGRESFFCDNVFIEAINVPCGAIPKSLLYFIGIAAMKKTLKKVLEKYGKPDIIHSHFPDISYICAKAIRKSDIPFVITEHSSKVNQGTLKHNERRALIYAYRQANKILAVSNHLCDIIQRDFNLKAVCVPNIVDLTLFSYSYNDNHRAYVFISVGNLLPIKRMLLLVESFLEAIKICPELKLYIFGEGIEKNKLQKLINVGRASNNIFLMGIHTRDEIARYFKNCGIFILLSESETFGVAYVEALASGVPVIATYCGGPADYIEQGVNGRLVDEKGIVEAILETYKDNKLFNRKKIADDIKNRYSERKTVETLIGIYESP